MVPRIVSPHNNINSVIANRTDSMILGRRFERWILGGGENSASRTSAWKVDLKVGMAKVGILILVRI